MPQRFLSIKNFEKYNPGSTRSYPWIKLYREMLLDVDFLQLDVTSRYLYVCLLILASDHGNKVPMNVSYLSHRCAMNVSEAMLKPLYKRGFLQASRSTIARLDKREIREEEKRIDPPLIPQGVTRVRGKVALPDDLVLTPEEQSGWDRFGINSAIEFAAFKDHARTEDRRCSDWEAAKRNWMRKAIRMKEEGRNRGMFQVR